ncbi:MAG: hypothetical protein ACOYOP_09430 [Microthrixaceae bacterium]
MSHMVIFQTQDGSPGYNQFESIDGAVAFVEKLRNEQGIENARIFALEEVKFELKPYFRVELQALTQGGARPGAPSPAAPGAPAAPSAAPSQPAAPSAPSPAPAEPTTFGAGSPLGPPPGAAPAQPSQPAPAPEAPEPAQPTRRGLFGR